MNKVGKNQKRKIKLKNIARSGRAKENKGRQLINKQMKGNCIMKKLVFKNYFFIGNQMMGVESIIDWIVKQELSGKESRIRTRFIKEIGERADEISKERKRMLISYAEKDKKTKAPIMFAIDKKGKEYETTDQKLGQRYKIKSSEKFEKEFKEYINEDYVIAITPANRDTVNVIKEMILNTEEKFKGQMSNYYDEWCEALENISEDKKEKKSKK